MGKGHVGIDLHRRRSVIYRMDQARDKMEPVRVDNDPIHFAKEVSAAPVGSDASAACALMTSSSADGPRELSRRHSGATTNIVGPAPVRM